MSVNVGNLINKTKIVPFLNKGTNDNPDWLQIKKSTSFNLSMNPTTKTFAFISEINESEEVTGYKPALSQEVILFKGEPRGRLLHTLTDRTHSRPLQVSLTQNLRFNSFHISCGPHQTQQRDC